MLLGSAARLCKLAGRHVNPTSPSPLPHCRRLANLHLPSSQGSWSCRQRLLPLRQARGAGRGGQQERSACPAACGCLVCQSPSGSRSWWRHSSSLASPKRSAWASRSAGPRPAALSCVCTYMPLQQLLHIGQHCPALPCPIHVPPCLLLLLQAQRVFDPVTGRPSSHAVLWMESEQRARDLVQASPPFHPFRCSVC